MATYTTITKPNTSNASIFGTGNYKNDYHLLNEDGSYLLNEDGSRLVLESAPSLFEDVNKPNTTYTTITKPT